MRQRRFRIANALAAAAVVCAASLVAAPTSALAEPSVAWETSLDNGVTPARMFGHMDGKVTAAACGAPSGDASQARTYTLTNAAGSAQDVANNTGPRLYACTGQSTLGKDGTLYASGVMGNQSRLLALKDGQLKWSKTFPTGCDDVYAMAMGVNGNVYGVVHCNGSYRLVGYTPEVAPGSTEPSVPLDVAITGQFGGQPNDSLATFGNGLVVQLANGVQYFSYEGSTSGPVVISNFGTIPDRTIAADTGGRTFYAVAATSGQQSLCGINPPPGIMGQIQAMAPDGPAWAHLLPECARVISLRPSINGGVIAELYQEHTNGGVGPAVRKLVSIGGSGEQLWELILETSASVDRYYINRSFSVTIRGDVLLQQSYFNANDSSINARRVGMTLVNGATGWVIASKELTGENQGYIVHGNVTAAMTNDRVYVALARCIWDSCGSERKLYALDFRGVDLDFPRGAVLKYNEPWLSYVALGDSYSSGEGVEPFIAPSDTNGCHRSRDAYAKLLDGSPASRLNVTSFVACSGATTQDVINGKNGEPSQLNALATNQARRVTISAGGNDIDFVGVATACVTGNCGDGESAEAIRKIREELPSKLDTLYAEIRARVTATNARILVVGYPLLIPEVVDQNLPNCFYLQDDKDAARSVILELDAAIQAAVSRAGSPFEYVDPNAPGSPFIGHELCKSGSYFHGLVWPFNQGYTFHPNAAGQQAYRQLIETRLAS